MVFYNDTLFHNSDAKKLFEKLIKKKNYFRLFCSNFNPLCKTCYRNENNSEKWLNEIEYPAVTMILIFQEPILAKSFSYDKKG